MAAPVPVGTPSIVGVNGIQLPTITVPSGLVNGDYLVTVIGCQDSTQTADYTNNGGMTRIGPAFVTADVANRVMGIWGLPVPVASSAPSTVTFTRSTSTGARQEGIMFIVRGVDLSNPVAIANSVQNTAGGTTATALGLTNTVADALAIAAFQGIFASPNSNTVTTPPAGMTEIAQRLEPPAGDTTVSRNHLLVYAVEADIAATGDKVLTWAGTTASRQAQMVLLRPSVANIAPTAAAGPDQSGVAAGATVDLDASGSTDPDGTVVKWVYTQTGGPGVTIVGADSSPTKFFTAPSLFAGATLTFSLVVTDNDGQESTPDTITITVNSSGTETISYVGHGLASLVTTAGAPTYPANLALNDALTLFVASNATINVPTPSGWTLLGTTAFGSPLFVHVFAKDSNGTESGQTVTITGFTNGTKGVAWIAARRASAGSLIAQTLRGGGDQSLGDLFAATTTPALAVGAGDVLGVHAASLATTGVYSGASGANPTITHSGATIGATTSRFAALTSGDTLWYHQGDSPVTVGGSGTAAFSATPPGGVGSGGGFAIIKYSLTPNIPPTANAGPTQNVNPGVTVTLTGGGSDPDGSLVGWDWLQVDGPPVTLSGSGANRTFTSPFVPGGTSLTFRLIVTDNAGLTSPPATVIINVASGTTFWSPDGETFYPAHLSWL